MTEPAVTPVEIFRAALRQVINETSVPFGNTISTRVEVFVPMMDRQAIIDLHNVTAAAVERREIRAAYQEVVEGGALIGYMTEVTGSLQMVRQLMEAWEGIAAVHASKQMWSASDVIEAAAMKIDLTRTYDRDRGV